MVPSEAPESHPWSFDFLLPLVQNAASRGAVLSANFLKCARPSPPRAVEMCV